MDKITTRTKLVGILGSPLGHTLSPDMQNQAFQNLGLDYYYLPIEVSAENLGAVVGGIRHMNFAGFNITMPHKMNIIQYLDEIDSLAEMIGSVNTVVIKDGRLKGYSTDGTGFVRSLELDKGISLKGKKIFILGAGGAAKSIALTLAGQNVREIVICNRTLEKAKEISDRVNRNFRHCCSPLPADPEKMRPSLSDVDILVNTTNLGMHPDTGSLPIEPKLLSRRLLVYDIIYHPLKTRLLEEAERAGCATMNGLGMLIYQGAEAFSLWTGLEAPIDVMKKSVFSCTNQA